MMGRLAFQYPPPPTIDVSVRKGTATETVDARPGSPEYDAWWAECQEVDRAREKHQSTFAYDYGVKEWKHPEWTLNQWTDQPPEGWEIDPIILEYELGTTDVKPRLQFVMFTLIQSPRDLLQINQVLYSGDTEPVMEAEVGAAEDSFQDDVEGEASQEL
jgi:hypothetical protein